MKMVCRGCSEAEAIATLYYPHSEETIRYSERDAFIKDYRDDIDTLGPNGVSASLLKEDIELGCEVFEIRAGAYGEQVNKDLYRELAKEYGIHSPEVQAAIVDMDQILENWHMEQMKQYHELLCEDQEFER